VKEPPEDYQLDRFDKLEFYPKVFQYLTKIVQELDYQLVMVTNQDGLGTDSFPEDTFWPVHNLILQTFENEGIHFDEVVIDRTFASEGAPTRKPNTGLLTHYMDGSVDLANSFVIGDRITDMELAKNLGCKGIWMNDEPGLGAGEIHADQSEIDASISLVSSDWKVIYEHLKAKARPRIGKVHRQTKETNILIEVNLDGTGKANIQTGLGFFDHMLDQLARHGNLDLTIQVEGDLHIDEHHTIEDTALALGEAFLQALGDKKGIQRYGFLLPMDECLAQVAIDFGGRPWLIWDAPFSREKIGDMPTEMFMHFFKSFSDTAKCNLNIKVEGENEHHKIESIFKAWAKAIRMAVKRDWSDERIPSTKGVL